MWLMRRCSGALNLQSCCSILPYWGSESAELLAGGLHPA